MKAVAAIILGLLTLSGCGIAQATDNEPWKNPASPIVIDAYELNIIDWEKLFGEKRVAGFISKASDGLPEVYDCTRERSGDSVAHCRTMWRKYAVSRELYQTRKLLAKAQGMLWGAYHLARPGNPIDQANHFLDYAKPGPDEMMVLDLEGLDSEKYMSLDDAEIFAQHIKTRTGRYPVLYTNHDTAKLIAARREDYQILSRLPLWYARYKPEIRGVFPMGNWDNYMLWQFSSASNCSDRNCPMRVDGTLNDIDVNTAPMPRAELARIWSRGELLPEKPPALQYLVSATGALGRTEFGAAHVRVGMRRNGGKFVETAANLIYR
jgi:GH25 family lysozyme M1 (1,4-beta-N-acetylmuramidase)